MTLAILTPCQSQRLAVVAAYRLGAAAARAPTHLAMSKSATVACLRRQLLASTAADVLLWWDADDWLRPAWILAALGAIEQGADLVWPTAALRVDVHTGAEEPLTPDGPMMTGGMVRGSIARSVPYPEPVEGRPDADRLWWHRVREAAPNRVALTVDPPDVVLCVHGRNIGAVPVTGSQRGRLPAEARAHVDLVRAATVSR